MLAYRMYPSSFKTIVSFSFQGTEAINGLVTQIDVPADKDSGKYKIHFARYSEGSKGGVKDSAEFDLIIGSDGANSRVAKVNTFLRVLPASYEDKTVHLVNLSI